MYNVYAILFTLLCYFYIIEADLEHGNGIRKKKKKMQKINQKKKQDIPCNENIAETNVECCDNVKGSSKLKRCISKKQYRIKKNFKSYYCAGCSSDI